jgi:superfamily II DNA or RNA helicase
MQLRDYQETVVDENLQAMSRGVKATLNGLFTGAGKTIIFCALAARIAGRTLIICPLRELVWQAVDKVREVTSLDPSIEMAEFQSMEDDWFSPQIVVASKQTLMSRRGGAYRYRKFTDFQLVIVDEAHLMCSPQMLEMFQYFQSNGAMIAGFTATPFRMDGKAMLRRDSWNSTNSSSVDMTSSGPSTKSGQCHPSANSPESNSWTCQKSE